MVATHRPPQHGNAVNSTTVLLLVIFTPPHIRSSTEKSYCVSDLSACMKSLGTSVQPVTELQVMVIHVEGAGIGIINRLLREEVKGSGENRGLFHPGNRLNGGGVDGRIEGWMRAIVGCFRGWFHGGTTTTVSRPKS